MSPKSVLPILLAALVLMAGGAFAQEGPKDEFFAEDVPVEVIADSLSYDSASDTYHAEGDVVITQEGTVLRADEVMLDMASGVATARGSVEMVDEGGNVVTGTDAVFNIREKTAVLARARLFYKDENIHLTGLELRKTGPQTYEGKDVTYTTCDCPDDEAPAWRFYTRRADVTVGEYLTARHVYFYIKDVPVLYSPYAVVPVKRPRQTGFLPPRPGYSELRGFIFDNSFFWAIAINADATFYLDAETSRGYGGGAEFRYIRNRKSEGETYLYYFKEKDIDRVRRFREGVGNLNRPESAGAHRWRYTLEHTEVLPANTVFKADVDLVSDDEFFIDFAEETDERTKESLETNVSLSKSWSSYSLVAQIRYFDNLLSKDDETTLQQLPVINFTRSNRSIPHTPLYLSWNSSYVNFSRKEGIESQRLDIRPRISLPTNPGGWFEFAPSVGPRATWYYVRNDPGGNKYAERYIYDVQADLTTTFVRIFRPELKSLKALRHSVRPKLNYTYVPEAVQTDLPSFDATDRVAAANKLTYTLTTILTAKHVDEDKTTYRDYLYLEISQSYDINEATRKLSSPSDSRRPFSDVAAEVILNPADGFSAQWRGSYDVNENWFENYDTSMTVTDARGDQVNLSYRYSRPEETYFESSALVKVTKSVDLSFLRRFSVDDGQALETTAALDYTHQCWSARLSYTDRLEENIFLLTFNLAGLGKVAGIKGEIEEF